MELQPGTARQVASLVQRMRAEFALLDEYDGGVEAEAAAEVEEDEEEEENNEEDALPARPVPSPRGVFEASAMLQLPTMDRSQRGLEEVPAEVWERSWLTRLSLARNRLATLEGERLSRALPSLAVLDLSHNRLQRLALRYEHLRELRLAGCPLTALSLSCPALQLLSLDGSRLVEGIGLVMSCRHLASLSLAGCSLSSLPNDIGVLALTYLDVSRNCLASLPRLPASLRQLNCSDNATLSLLGALPASLERCVASHCALTSVDLSSSFALEHLDVRYNALDSVVDLSSCVVFKELLCAHNMHLSELRLCESLQLLNVDCCGLVSLPALPAGLTRLFASCCFELESVTGPFPESLTELRLCFAPHLTALPYLPASLTSLWLSHCPLLSIALSSSPHLQTLVFSSSPLVVPPVPLECPVLTVLRASECPHRLELTTLTLLEQLDVASCPDGEAPLDSAGLRDVECAACPWLEVDGDDSGHAFVGPREAGAAQAMGLRPTMEDAWGGAVLPNGGRLLLLCDGHAGREAAAFVASHLLSRAESVLRDPGAAIGETDAALRKHLAQRPAGARHAGTTLLLAFRTSADSAVTVVNVGDSRAVRFESASCFERVSRDHKPWDEEECIRSRGGWVANGRVNGVLGVGRALGDYHLQPALSAEPHIASCGARGVMVLGCDGLFDEISDALLALLVSRGGEATAVAARLRDAALALGTDDNVSVIVWPL